MLDAILTKLVYFLVPIPLLKEALAGIVCNNKVIFVSFFIAILLTPILLIGSAFSTSASLSSNSSEEEMKRNYFDRQYNVLCRGSPSECEIKPESEYVVSCQKEPEKCRKKREKVDCNNSAHQGKYCRLVTQSYTDSDGNTSSSSYFEKISNADELYYMDQQKQEEDKQNVFKWLLDLIGDSVSGAIDGTVGAISNLGTNIQPLPEVLKGYIEPNIENSGIPNGNPFGGDAYDNVIVTCVWHCGNYVAGLDQHQGMDMKPSSLYYSSNKASKDTGGNPIVFTTCSGTAHSYSTISSGNQVRIKCKDTDYYVTFMHLSAQFIPVTQTEVKAGMPVGMMGNTGALTTGAHLHYQINQGCLEYSTNCTRDPRPFISTKEMYNCNNCL